MAQEISNLEVLDSFSMSDIGVSDHIRGAKFSPDYNYIAVSTLHRLIIYDVVNKTVALNEAYTNMEGSYSTQGSRRNPVWAEDGTGLLLLRENHAGSEENPGDNQWGFWVKTTDDSHISGATLSNLKVGYKYEYRTNSRTGCRYYSKNTKSFLLATCDDNSSFGTGIAVIDLVAETISYPFHPQYQSYINAPVTSVINDKTTDYIMFFNRNYRFFIYDVTAGEFLSKTDFSSVVGSEVIHMLVWDTNKVFCQTENDNLYYFIDYSDPVNPVISEVNYNYNLSDDGDFGYSDDVSMLGRTHNFCIHPNGEYITFLGNQRQELITWNPEKEQVYEYRYSLTGGGYGDGELYLLGITPDLEKIMLVQNTTDPWEIFICSGYNPEGKLAFRIPEVNDACGLAYRQNSTNNQANYTHYYLNSNPEDGLLSPLDLGSFDVGSNSLERQIEFVNHTTHDLENVVVRARLSENTTFELNSEVDVYISKTNDFSGQLSELTYTGPYVKDAFDTFYVQVQSTQSAEELRGEILLSIYADVVST